MTARDRAASAARHLRGRESNRALRARVDRLEAELQENRQLNRRIAELTDVVTELLVPLSQSDRAGLDSVLARYRAKI